MWLIMQKMLVKTEDSCWTKNTCQSCHRPVYREILNQQHYWTIAPIYIYLKWLFCITKYSFSGLKNINSRLGGQINGKKFSWHYLVTFCLPPMGVRTSKFAEPKLPLNGWSGIHWSIPNLQKLQCWYFQRIQDHCIYPSSRQTDLNNQSITSGLSSSILQKIGIITLFGQGQMV